MQSKVLVQMESPVTQKPEAVEALAVYLNKTIEGGVLDLGAAKLVKSNKGDCFYTVTARKCSCPSAAYRGGPCKHMRAYFPQLTKPAAKDEGSIRPTGSFKPFSLLPSEEKNAAREMA
jgi:hypothetical protein